ncbi:MAG: glyoxalase/bleomycin resistance/dioxygenase family protein, partial [Acidiferrobacterales bacterium]
SLETDRLGESEAFMKKLGMRAIVKSDAVAVLELRGGTHLVLRVREKVTPGEVPFDLMVDDLEETHQRFTEMGLAPSAIEKGRIHRSFKVREPAGHIIKFNSTHVSGRPV